MKKLIAITLIFIPLSALSDAEVNSWEFVEFYEVDREEIVQSILDRNFDKAGDLIYDLAVEKLREKIFTEKGQIDLAERLAKKLEELINSNDSDEVKKDKLFLALENSFSTYKSSKKGILNAQLSYSVGAGATKISWDNKVHEDKCETYMVGTECEEKYNSTTQQYEYVCVENVEYQEVYVTRLPNYKVFRVVNGEEIPIADIKGKRLTTEFSYSFTDFGSTLKNLYEKLTSEEEAINWGDRPYIYDYYGNMYTTGDNIQYKVVSDDGAQRLGDCGNRHHFESFADHDVDGDGYPDYVPISELVPASKSVPAILNLTIN